MRLARLPFLPPLDSLVCSSVRHGLTLLLYGLWNKSATRTELIVLSRTDLTNRFAKNGRRGLTVDDLYLRLIPHLMRIGQAKALPEEGKLERYAFRVEVP